MTDSPGKQFGLLIAYVLPGFIALAGSTPLFPVIAHWLRPVSQGDLGVAAPVYAVLAATAAGLVISCFRWLTLDQIHAWTGVRRPVLDDRQLASVLDGFDYLVQSHFRYYEFTGNALLACLWSYAVNRYLGTLPFLGFGTDLGMLVISLVLFAASRDALAKYFSRTGRLVGSVASFDIGEAIMFNGNDHAHDSGSSNQPKSAPKQPANPKRPARSTPQPKDKPAAK